MINIDFILPEFALMLNEICKKEKTRPRVIFSHKAFEKDELQLLGSAVKYALLKNVSVWVGGNKPNGKHYDLDSELYSVNQVELIGEAIKKRVDTFESIKIISHFNRACENCGLKLSENHSQDFEDSHYSMAYHRHNAGQYNMTEDYKLFTNRDIKKISAEHKQN
jgi:hypothetical protein